MLRSVLARVLALVICVCFVTALLADEGKVVSYEKGKVTVKIKDKDKEIALKGVKVIGTDGKAVKGKMFADVLTKDTKVDVTEKDGKVTEIKVLK